MSQLPKPTPRADGHCLDTSCWIESSHYCLCTCNGCKRAKGRVLKAVGVAGNMWHQKDGDPIPISEMTDLHLKNAIRHCLRIGADDSASAMMQAFLQRRGDL